MKQAKIKDGKLTEWEFETAICQFFPILLPELNKAGYRIVSRQAVLFGRRLDLFLENDKDEAMIVELKVGNPDPEKVCEQILDYKKCFERSSPGSPVRLMVISNKMSSSVMHFIEEENIETKVIENADILKAFESNVVRGEVQKGKKLDAESHNDVGMIRYLLSDFSKIQKPASWNDDSGWTHEKVFYALCARGEKHKDLWKKDTYVQFYPQKYNAAILYHPDSKYVNAPIHLNRNSAGWDGSKFQVDENIITYVQSDNKGATKKNHNFDHYKIKDWDLFAKQLGLDL